VDPPHAGVGAKSTFSRFLAPGGSQSGYHAVIKFL
jgi:hypothetical protein